MKHLNLSNLGRAAMRALRTGNFEMTPGGLIHLRQEHSFIGGSFRAAYAPPDGDFGPPVISHNRVVGQGLVHLLNLLGQHATASPLYIAPWVNDTEPQAGWTGANFNANASEFTAYTPTTRVPWTTVPLTNVANLNNSAALAAATITFAAGGPYTIRGAALLEGSAKGGTTGRLIVASRFPDDLTGMMGNGRLSLEYSLVAMDEADAA